MSRLAVLIFVALWILAMSVYPGGNSFDPDSSGHDVLRNFLCDILASTTPAGRSNLVGSIAMNSGMVVLVIGGLLPLWWRLPYGDPLRRILRVLGLIAAILTLTICVEQAFDLAWSHNTITLSAGAAGLVPTMLLALCDWRSSDSTAARRVFLVGTILASLVNFVSYTLVQLGGTLTMVVPVAQSVALVCLVVWLFLQPRPRSAGAKAAGVTTTCEGVPL